MLHKLIRHPIMPIFLGVLGFLLVVGIKVLRPDNIAWLHEADSAVSFVGWHFFRQSPWGWPLAANPSNGMEVSSSVFYSDSMPLLALLFKPFSSLLPEPFQYVGWWLLACFVLQDIALLYDLWIHYFCQHYV